MIDPDAVLRSPAIGAHEVGHALGLRDIKDPTRLMNESDPPGRTLTSAECRTIQDNLPRLSG